MTKGTSTYKGLAVPLFGDSEIKQETAGTDALTITSVASPGACNVFNVAVTDASAALATGYLQGIYTSMAVTGVYSNGCQINAFASDITLSGTPGVEVSGMYLYFSETGTTVVTDLQLNGVAVYFADMGGAMANRAAFHAYSEATHLGADIDAAFYAYCSGASGTWTALLGSGGSTAPEFFFENSTALGGSARMLVAYAPDAAATHALRIRVDGTIYNIPLVPDSCS